MKTVEERVRELLAKSPPVTHAQAQAAATLLAKGRRE